MGQVIGVFIAHGPGSESGLSGLVVSPCYTPTNIFHIFKFANSVGILHSLSSLANFKALSKNKVKQTKFAL